MKVKKLSIKLLDAVYEARDKGLSKEDTLLEMAQLSGIYVPRFYEPQYDAGGMFCGMQVSTQVPASVKRQWVRELIIIRRHRQL